MSKYDKYPEASGKRWNRERIGSDGMEIKRLYIDGEWVNGSEGKTFSSINPATGEVLAEIAEASVEDTKKAIAAAKKSFYVTREWRDMDSQARGDILLKIADALEEEKEELARLESMDMGKPLREAEADIDDGIHCFRYYASMIKMPHGGCYEVNTGFGEMHSYTIHEPVGVCAEITPWNYPLLMGIWKLAPSLAAGNSVIFKPASVCVLSCIRLFEIFEKCGIPKGAANLVMGPGSIVGDCLAESPDVDMITFTGSTEVGQSIMRKAASNVKKIGLELGGKSPNVIFADADLDGAVEWAMIGIFLNQGEVCSAGSRILIEESVKEEFLKRLAKKANAITIGNPLDNPDMGALVSESHMKRVLSYIEQGKKEGARLVCGGERYTEGECAKGFFVRPTIFDDCTSDMK
ncbi:MAG: aldehyde dehydrogenase family protein, partial [Eubacteriales bacterium]|nr:aldehyde dehydrogenase family protein [Eubacteriales bacterium]